MIEILLMIVLPASIIFNILLLIRGINLVKQNERLSDSIKGYNTRELETINTLESMLFEMKEIDLRGSFESDDEVGVVFTELKNTIENYKNQI